MDVAAAASYEANFGTGTVFAGPIEEWLSSSDMPTGIDVVVGGPPCQGFSTLGKQREEDYRNGLWHSYAETLVRVQPKYFVVENVAAFGRSRQYQSFKRATWKNGFLRNYSFEVAILNSADYGSPQTRKRAVLIGHHRDLPFPGFPEITHFAEPDDSRASYVTVGEAFEGVPLVPDRDNVLEDLRSVRFANKVLPGFFATRELHWSRQYSALSLNRFSDIPKNGNRFDIREEWLADCWRKHKSGSGDVMGRLREDRPSVTIRTEFFKPEKGRYLHPTENRAITHYEAALLQGFPLHHRFVGSRTSIARQIGNAVPIPMGSAIARQLERAL